MKTKQTIRLLRVEDNKVILIPSKEGIEKIRSYFVENPDIQLKLIEGIEKVGDQNIIALIVEYPSAIQYFKIEGRIATDNALMFYGYTVNMERLGFVLPYNLVTS